jgi:hypothetical protein
VELLHAEGRGGVVCVRGPPGGKKANVVRVLANIDEELERAGNLCKHVQEIIEIMDWSPFPAEANRQDLLQLLTNVRVNIIQARVLPTILKHQLRESMVGDLLRRLPKC